MKMIPRVLTGLLLTVVVFGWRYGFGTKDHAVLFQIFLGYWWMWAVFIAAIWATLKLLPNREVIGQLRTLLNHHKAPLILIAGCSAFLHVHEPHDFKVLYDEPSHLQVSQIMHLDRQPLVASRGHYVGDNYVLLNTYPSFRQYFFPFILSLSHDLLGFSPVTPFVFNAVLTVFLLTAVYALGLLLGSRFTGSVATLFVTAIPLVAQNVTCAGYDIFNLLEVTLIAIGGISFLRCSDERAFAWLNWTGAMALVASQIRYESIIYYAFVLVLIALRWFLRKQLVITWFTALIPLATVPSFTSNMIFMETEVFKLPGLRDAGESFMGIEHVFGNFQDLLVFLYRYDPKSTGSVLVSVVGTVGLVALLARVATRRFKFEGESLLLYPVAALFSIVGAGYVVVLANFWGTPLDGLAARFSLPLWLCLSVAGAWLVTQFSTRKSVKNWVFGIIGFSLVTGTARANSAHGITTLMIPSRVERWFLEFAGRHERNTTLFVSRSNVQLMAHQYAAISMDALIKRPELAVKILQAGIYNDIFILERSEFPQTEEGTKKKDVAVLPAHILVEEVAKRSFAPGQLTRILRFLGYRNAEGVIVTKESAPPLETLFKNEAKRDTYILSLYP